MDTEADFNSSQSIEHKDENYEGDKNIKEYRIAGYRDQTELVMKIAQEMGFNVIVEQSKHLMQPHVDFVVNCTKEQGIALSNKVREELGINF